jgi:hypothetical protein
MGKQRLLVLLDVDEEALPAGNAYTNLPTALERMLSKGPVGRALTLSEVYLLNPACDIEETLWYYSVNYHHYAVGVRGETCTEHPCEQHPVQLALSLHDHQQRCASPPGLN